MVNFNTLGDLLLRRYISDFMGAMDRFKGKQLMILTKDLDAIKKIIEPGWYAIKYEYASHIEHLCSVAGTGWTAKSPRQCDSCHTQAPDNLVAVVELNNWNARS